MVVRTLKTVRPEMNIILKECIFLNPSLSLNFSTPTIPPLFQSLHMVVVTIMLLLFRRHNKQKMKKKKDDLLGLMMTKPMFYHWVLTLNCLKRIKMKTKR